MEKFAHGGNIFFISNKLGISPDELLDFSANINPLGLPMSVKKVIFQCMEDITHYPPNPPIELIKAASKFYRANEEEIVFGNGSTELLYILPRVVNYDRAVILVPSYVDYEKVCKINNIKIDFLYLKEEKGFSLNSLEELKYVLKQPSMVFIGQPNNPTGKIIQPELLREMALSYPESLFIIDEAFADFAEGLSRMYENRPENVIVLLSLTKFYAIPGLRLGLMIGSEKIISQIKEYLPPWSINTISQRVGEFFFQDKDYREKTVSYIKTLRKELFNKLKSIPEIHPYSSDANFILCKITSKRDVSYVKDGLLKKNIIIRDCSNYKGLDSKFFRIAVKKKEENKYLIECLKDIFSNTKKTINSKKTIKYTPYGPKTSLNTPAIMFVGTCSNAGKSILSAGLCRILLQEGFRVAPFKAQNMSLNSYVTKDGGEMGRAQVLQAQACKLDPDVRMNPVLLKPSSDTGSQVIVMGEPVGNMKVDEYIKFKKELLSTVRQAYNSLASEFDVIVIEGAGSPAEINLKSHDITNMEMARYSKANTLLVGDIDRGGVFASFIGTIQLLDKWERDLIKGLVINKFRGDKSLLYPAIRYTEEFTGKPFFGVIPYIKNLGLPEEDSVSFKMGWDKIKQKQDAIIKIGCIDLPHISNFTDLDPFLIEPDVDIKIIKNPTQLKDKEFDAIIIPGSKNVIKDNEYLIESGLSEIIKQIAIKKSTQIIGICGGFQIIGKTIHDPYNIESDQKNTKGLGLIPTVSELKKQKTLIQATAVHLPSGLKLKGYEIHHGKTICETTDDVICVVKNHKGEPIGYGTKDLKIWGTYLHGIFDEDEFRRWFIDSLRKEKGINPLKKIIAHYDIEKTLDRLAQVMRENMNINKVIELIKNRG